MTDDIIIPEEAFAPHLAEARRRALRLSPPIEPNALTAPGGEALSRYLLLEHWPELFQDDSVTERAVFYSKYYWFKRFAADRADATGYDAGLEQQVFQMLEAPPVEVDWDLIEEVDRQAAVDTRERGTNL